MAITINTSFVNTPVEKLFADLVIGSDTLDKGVAQLIPSKRKEIALNRFYTTGDNITTPPADGKWATAILNDSSTKDEVLLPLVEFYWSNEFDVRKWNVDHEFMWSQGPDAMMNPSQTLLSAITPSVVDNFNNELDRILWQNTGSKLGAGNSLEELMTLDATVIDTASPATPIDASNVIAHFEEMLTLAATVNPAILTKGSPSFVVPLDVAAAYQSAARALPNKGNNITSAIDNNYGGFSVMGVYGMSAGSAVFTNIGGGDDANIKIGTWLETDRNNVEIARTGPLDDTFGIKIAMTVGVSYVYGKQIVYHRGRV